ncbi:hypothetical protein [Lachnoclostridium sp. An76]|uniref:hypothetical protein n=1 Tax=Lachnoclostridium sp. An76 TaxID=1965654 RepID=UPI000B3956DE|nr:hypothetical protein [Lachnoclostridium sp. An76]OUN36037.1 hypothetical protein B5G27_02490 [Lachnoclostridium sp. An76]
MIKKLLLIISMIFILGVSMLLGGCGNNQSDSDANKQVEKPEEVLKNIGTEAEGENIYKVVLENKTGKNIVGFSIKDSSMAEFPVNMLETEDVFADQQKRNLYYDSTSAKEMGGDQAVEAEEDAKVLQPQIDIQLTFDDQSVLVLSAFPFGDVEEAQIYLEDEVAFIQYESLANNEMISTKEAELTIKAEKEAAAQAEAEAAAAAQAQAEAEAAAAAQAQAEAEAAAAAQAQAEAEAAAQAEAARQQAAQQQAPSNQSDGCVNGGLVY